MSGVHRLQHVEGLGAAALTDDDSVGSHAQRVAHEIANRHLAHTFGVRRAGFEVDDVGLLQTQLGFQSSILFNGIDGLFRVLVFVIFLYSVSWMKDMNRVFQYHGAEHKTVYNFESRKELKVATAQEFSTLHPRCGTSFLLVVMIVSILVFSLVHFSTFGGKLLSRIILLPLVAGISYEIIRYSAKHPKSILRIVTYPGLLLQKITTQPPDDHQVEIAIRALEEALTV